MNDKRLKMGDFQMLNRRNFIKNAAGLLVAAPMVVKAESLMFVNPSLTDGVDLRCWMRKDVVGVAIPITEVSGVGAVWESKSMEEIIEDVKNAIAVQTKIPVRFFT